MEEAGEKTNVGYDEITMNHYLEIEGEAFQDIVKVVKAFERSQKISEFAIKREVKTMYY